MEANLTTYKLLPAIWRKGINDNFKNSTTIIDKFHVIKHVNDAVDATRKAEVKTNSELSRTKYIWLKNDENLSDRQRAQKESLCKKHLKTARAYSMRVELQDIYNSCETMQLDDAFKTSGNEEVLRYTKKSLGRNSELLR